MNNKSDTETFVSQTVRPFLEALTDKIEIAFDIPEQLKGFASIDPVMIPQKSEKLKIIWDWWNQFTGFVLWSSNNHHRWIGPTNWADALCIQFKAYKLFILKDRLNYEYKQQSKLTSMQQKLDHKI